MLSLSSLLLLSSLLNITTCTVYIVTPDGNESLPLDQDDDYYPNTTCPHCHNLQYYLLNVTKYFTSNTQLLFLPGVHYLYSDLIIQNVHNISLIGNSSNYIAPVEIDCWFHSSITINNSSMVTIKNFMLIEGLLADSSLKFLNCYYVQLHNVTMNRILIGHNMMGESVLSNITSDGIDITYDDNISVESVNVHKLIIYNYATRRTEPCVKVEQSFYEVSIIITDSIFSSDSITVFITSSCTTHHENTVVFNKIHFLNSLISIHFRVHNHRCSNKSINKHDKVIIKNCYFLHINSGSEIIDIKWFDRPIQNLIIENSLFTNNNIHIIIYSEWFHEVKTIGQNILIKECIVKNNFIRNSILSFYSHHNELSDAVYIISSKFVFNMCTPINYPFKTTERCSAVMTSNLMVQLEGPIIVHNNVIHFLFVMKMYSTILFHNYIEYSQNQGKYMIHGSYVILLETVTLNISENDISKLFFKNESDINSHIYHYAFFSSMETKLA